MTEFGDRDLVQALCAFRLCFPEVGFILSTREPEALRDAMVPLGVTHMSAGSHTEPGGYTRVGEDDLHLTVKGRRVERDSPTDEDRATGQFGIADERAPEEVAARLSELGFEPVWKDWDAALLGRRGFGTGNRGTGNDANFYDCSLKGVDLFGVGIGCRDRIWNPGVRDSSDSSDSRFRNGGSG